MRYIQKYMQIQIRQSLYTHKVLIHLPSSPSRVTNCLPDHVIYL